MSIKYSMSTPKKQRGMTLMTTMVILVVMTIVTMLSSKLSILDTQLARNNKVKILVYQEASNDLRELAQIENLHDPMANKKFEKLSGLYTMPVNDSKKETKEMITDLGDDELYDCEGFSGRASSIGLDARKCDLFDFQVIRQKSGLSGANDKHHAGMGKEVPPMNKYSNL